MSNAAVGATLNIVDDERPTQRTYARMLSKRMTASPWMFPVSWALMRMLAHTIWRCNRILFQGRLKLPGILVPQRLHARFKPFEYQNQRAKEILRWRPRYALQTALDRSCGDLDLLSVPCDSSAAKRTRSD